MAFKYDIIYRLCTSVCNIGRQPTEAFLLRLGLRCPSKKKIYIKALKIKLNYFSLYECALLRRFLSDRKQVDTFVVRPLNDSVESKGFFQGREMTCLKVCFKFYVRIWHYSSLTL